MDQGEISKAAVLALSLDPEAIAQFPNSVLADRLMEARIRCFADLELWEDAETEMLYFEPRRKEDPNCGIDLINLFKFLDPPSLDEPGPADLSTPKGRVIAAITDLVNGELWNDSPRKAGPES